MGYRINDSDISILKTAGASDSDIKHCIKVAEKALDIAEKTGVGRRRA